MDEVEIKRVDALYKSFPSFSEWKRSRVDLAKWDKYQGRLTRVSKTPPDVLKKALSIVKRTAAIETGAVEGLYEVDRGFTITVATQAALWETALNQKGEETKSLIEGQLRAYDYVLDFATRREEMSEAWIRELHKQICAGQKEYLVHTPIGVQKHPLPLGEYKHLPNHVIKQDGAYHAYCPVDLTPAEMHRLVQEMRSSDLQDAHPSLQASYAHYGFVAIHPFADGNGRVARALASSFTTRAISVPLLVLADDQKRYIDSLQAADNGSYGTFVQFVYEKCLDAIEFVVESIKAATLPELEDVIEEIGKLYVTKGGFTHVEVDKAGITLLQTLSNEIQSIYAKYQVPEQHSISMSWSEGSHELVRQTSRLPINNNGRILNVLFSSVAPAVAHTKRRFVTELPIDSDIEDELLLRDLESGEEFGVRIREVLPSPTGALHMRLRVFAEKILRAGMAELAKEAARSRNTRTV